MEIGVLLFSIAAIVIGSKIGLTIAKAKRKPKTLRYRPVEYRPLNFPLGKSGEWRPRPVPLDASCVSEPQASDAKIEPGMKCKVLRNDVNALASPGRLLTAGDTIKINRIEGTWAFYKIPGFDDWFNYIPVADLEPVHSIEVIWPEPPKLGEYCKLPTKPAEVVQIERIEGDTALLKNSTKIHILDLWPIRIGDKMRVLRNVVGARTSRPERRDLEPGDEVVVTKLLLDDRDCPKIQYWTGNNTNFLPMTDVEHAV